LSRPVSASSRVEGMWCFGNVDKQYPSDSVTPTQSLLVVKIFKISVSDRVPALSHIASRRSVRYIQYDVSVYTDMFMLISALDLCHVCPFSLLLLPVCHCVGVTGQVAHPSEATHKVSCSLPSICIPFELSFDSLSSLPTAVTRATLRRTQQLLIDQPLGTTHPIYRTDVPLLPSVRFLYI